MELNACVIELLKFHTKYTNMATEIQPLDLELDMGPNLAKVSTPPAPQK